jgi:hypothetical protein
MLNKIFAGFLCFGAFAVGLSQTAQDEKDKLIESRALTAVSNLQQMTANRYLHGNYAQAHETEVAAKDVLMQIDVILSAYDFKTATAQQTVDDIRRSSLLNRLQIQINALKKIPADPHTFAGAFEPDVYDQTFYDLRAIVCRRHPGMAVSLDGKLKSCD